MDNALINAIPKTPRRSGRTLLVSVASLLMAVAGHAATYYVDNCEHIGADSHVGNTQSSPWLTLAKVNAASLSPGDIVKLRRGCTWNETLRPHNSGQSSRPIIFSPYGTGPKPLVHGGTLVGSHWRSSGEGLYRFDPHGFPSGVFRNGMPLSAAPSLLALRSSQLYFYDHQYVWIRSQSNPNTSPDHIDLSKRSVAIDVHGVSHLRFEGLRTAYASGADVDISASFDITLVAVDGSMGGGAGFYCQAGSHDIQVIGGTWSGAGWSGKDGDNIAIGGNDPESASFACRALLVQGAELSGASEACIAVDTTFNNSTASDIRLIGNYCHNSQRFGIFVGGAHRNIVIQSNVLANNGASGIVFNEGTSGSPSGTICNNTLWSNGAHASGADGSNIQLQSSEVTVANNLIANAHGPEIAITEGRTPSFDSNLYWDPSGGTIIKQGSSSFASVAEWNRASGGDAGSLSADPQLKDAANGDFRPRLTSPALHAGTDLGPCFALTLDTSSTINKLALVPRPLHVRWNIGAY